MMMRFFGKDMKNNIPKLCINCKYFIADEVRWPDEISNNSQLGKCKLFGKLDVVTGDIIYDYAYSVRNDKGLCGETGKLFETNKESTK